MAATSMSAEEMVTLSKQYTFWSWSAQDSVNPIPMDRAEGIYFWTPDGKRYIDMNSQLMCVNIGHGNKKVIRAIQDQAEKLAYAGPSMASEVRAILQNPARREKMSRAAGPWPSRTSGWAPPRMSLRKISATLASAYPVMM